MNKEEMVDYFINSSVDIDIGGFVYSVLLAAILGYVVKIAYIHTSQTISNKHYFSDIFVPLAMVTCVVITVVKFSLALSLGLVGALSIVRFRAAIKEPEELVFLFLCIGAGLATGANQYLVAVISITLIVFILFIMKLKRIKYSGDNRVKNENENIINIESSRDRDILDDVIDTMNKYTKSIVVKSSIIDGDTQKFSFVVIFNKYSDYLKFTQEFNNKYKSEKMSLFSRTPIAE